MLDHSIQEEHKDSTEDLEESINFFNVYEQKNKQHYEVIVFVKTCLKISTFVPSVTV